VFQRLMQSIVTPETLRVQPVRELQERVQWPEHSMIVD
jgi:hypothetical protein